MFDNIGYRKLSIAGLVSILALVVASGCSSDASVVSESGSASASRVVAPDYTVSFGSLVLQVDAASTVLSASGTVGLAAGGQTSEGRYVISSNASLGPSFAAIDAEYKAGGTPSTVGATIDASELTLVGETLPVVRNVIVSHTVDGVPAYEVIRIAFNGP